jgi:tRNA (cmo5U34)-methyltransferase
MSKRIMYSGDGNGRWWKLEFPSQCEHNVFMAGQCQRVKGHDGDHWCYSGGGSYGWSSSRKDLKAQEVAGGCTPPGHKKWIHPIDKATEYHTSNVIDHGEVTNRRLLARLNRGEMRDGESLNQPLRIDELKPSVRRSLEKARKHACSKSSREA